MYTVVNNESLPLPFSEGWGNYAIRGIEEILLPESVSLLPQTIGWAILLLAAIAWLFLIGYRKYQHYRANLYRLVSLNQLKQIKNAYQQGDTTSVRALPALLKATALQVYPRTTIAALTGNSWCVFLSDTYPGPPFETEPIDILYKCGFAPKSELNNLLEEKNWNQFVEWIKHHRWPND